MNRSYKKKSNKIINKRKKNTIKKHFSSLRCSPISNHAVNKNTCYNSEMINELVYNWNKKHKNNKIDNNLNSNEKYKQLQNRLQDKCSDERCWASELVQTDVDKYLELFAPYSPSTWINNPTEWLSNIEIIMTLKQYEKYDKSFKFLGTTPIDFDTVIDNKCVTTALCRFSLTKYIKKGINKIGIIFNTDKHDQAGSHWISLYIDIHNKLIFFFDSAGDQCPQEILNLVNRIIQQGKTINILFKFEQNYPMVHQTGTTECGMYCLFFIINMVKNSLPINYFKTKRIPDEEMIKYRNIYFNKSSAST